MFLELSNLGPASRVSFRVRLSVRACSAIFAKCCLWALSCALLLDFAWRLRRPPVQFMIFKQHYACLNSFANNVKCTSCNNECDPKSAFFKTSLSHVHLPVRNLNHSVVPSLRYPGYSIDTITAIRFYITTTTDLKTTHKSSRTATWRAWIHMSKAIPLWVC